MEENNLQHWKLEVDAQQIIWLGFDRKDASANSISMDVLTELDDICSAYKDRSEIKGLVIYSCKNKGFIAGADLHGFAACVDITEIQHIFEKGRSVFQKLATLKFPTVALIKGFCLGGGLELALACRYRIAEESPDTVLGFPEIKLGIYPAWGGSVRAPRLIGASPALDLMLTGRPISATQAKKIRLVHEVVPLRQLKRAAVSYILTRPRTQRLSLVQRYSNHALFRPLIAKLARGKLAAKRIKIQDYPAPYALLNTWLHRGVDDAAFEAETLTVLQLIQTKTAQNLMRVFFLQEKLKSSGKNMRFEPAHIHVIGAGIMGGDIAAWCAYKGFRVTLYDPDLTRIGASIARAHELAIKKLKQPHLIQAMLDRLQGDPEEAGLEQADLIIEAIIENVEAKQELFKKLEQHAKKDAIFATNTSSIPLDEINGVLANPQRLIGMHFFNPVSLMPLIEVVYGARTSMGFVSKVTSFVRRLDRLPLLVKSSPGFLVNRILMPYLMEAFALYESGVPPSQIDQAAVDFGMPMGPVELADVIGLDVCLYTAEKLVNQLPMPIPQLLRDKVVKGELGKKTGKGFYTYKKGKAVKTKLGRASGAEQITQRLVLSILNEAVTCLEEEVVSEADLIDAGLIFGTGFAPFHGGPLTYAKSLGQEAVLQQLYSLEKRVGERFKPRAGWAHVFMP